MDARELIDRVDHGIECVECGKRARYCTCPRGAVVVLERAAAEIAPLIGQYGGCDFCPMDFD